MTALEFKFLDKMLFETRNLIKQQKKLTRVQKDAMAVSFIIMVRDGCIDIDELADQVEK